MLKIHTRNLGNVTVYCLEGRFVNGETAALRNAMYSESNAGAIVFDLARVSTIDASGLGLLLELRRQAQLKGAGFKLMNASRFISRVFEITRLDSVFEVIPRVKHSSAISSTQRPRIMELAPCA